MPLITAAIVGGVLTAGSAMYSSSQQRESTAEANRMNVNLNRENREWQERMAGSAHQREVMDLRLAGLNPILSGTGGAGAGTPGTSAASVVAEPPTSFGDVGGAASSAMMAKLTMDKMKEDTKVSHEQYLKAAEETEMTARANAWDEAKVKYYQGDKTSGSDDQRAIWDSERDQKLVGVAAQKQSLKHAILDYHIGQSAEAKAKVEEQINKSSFGELLMWVDRLSKSVQGARGATK